MTKVKINQTSDKEVPKTIKVGMWWKHTSGVYILSKMCRRGDHQYSVALISTDGAHWTGAIEVVNVNNIITSEWNYICGGMERMKEFTYLPEVTITF